ncbi:MAG TPA: glycosyltransferase [Patescibacteria group bacterium]|nr:glycosyltransferase [Patescibacteria group bacterium]
MKKEKLVSVIIVTRDRKKDLLECLNSYVKSSYKNIEIIVIDNASRPPVLTWLPKKFKNVNLITRDTNVGAAEGRNIGIENAKGEYLIFTDDDAYAGRDMVKNLIDVFAKQKKAGIVQPLIYDKNKKNFLQGAGHDVNLLTGRIRAWGVQEKDMGQYDGIREVPLCGCVWMVKRNVIEKIGNYDEDYFIPYEDSDFSMRAREAGFKLYCYSKAKSWHQGIKKTFVHPRIEWLGITSKERAFRVAKNKMIFMRKHSPFPQNIFFFLIMLPAYILVHSAIIISSGRFDVLWQYFLGILSGILYILFYPFFGLRKVYKDIDKKLTSSKLFLMAWTEPIGWLINKNAKTILDVGCGEGLPMRFIKIRMKPKHTVGVDLFEPYIEESRKKKIHNEYVLSDIRKLPFKNKSFDVVISLQVLEHLTKKEAWSVLEKMEKIAKKQVIVATPVGEMYHPAVDSNPLQMHQSDFQAKDFEDRGYKTLQFGRKSLFGEEGIVHKVKNDFLRKLIYFVNILLTPFFYAIPSINDYHIYAVKDLTK